MLKDTQLDGYCTNHSLHWSGVSRLFHAGIDKKLIRKFSGQQSDALDQYEITSHDQRMVISSIIVGSDDSVKKSPQWRRKKIMSK